MLLKDFKNLQTKNIFVSLQHHILTVIVVQQAASVKDYCIFNFILINNEPCVCVNVLLQILRIHCICVTDGFFVSIASFWDSIERYIIRAYTLICEVDLLLVFYWLEIHSHEKKTDFQKKYLQLILLCFIVLLHFVYVCLFPLLLFIFQ